MRLANTEHSETQRLGELPPWRMGEGAMEVKAQRVRGRGSLEERDTTSVGRGVGRWEAGVEGHTRETGRRQRGVEGMPRMMAEC